MRDRPINDIDGEGITEVWWEKMGTLKSQALQLLGNKGSKKKLAQSHQQSGAKGAPAPVLRGK